MLCRRKLEWDDTVPEEVRIKWKQFIAGLVSIGEVNVKRYTFYEVSHNILNVEIHAFADSSKQAYACVVYVRVHTKVGIRVCLLTSKSKVAPLGETSIPRLELLACVLLVKLVKEIQLMSLSQLKGHEWYAWSDSRVALWWIRDKVKSWKPWVENRVVLIRETITGEKWNYIQSKENPADIPTRMDNFENFTKGPWFKGPKFLYEVNYVIPKFDCNNTNCPEEAHAEKKKAKVIDGAQQI